jgi:type IV pilus assembly protein PilV
MERQALRLFRAGQRGLTLVEMVVAMSVFSVVALGVGLTLVRGAESRQESFLHFRAINALRDFLAEVQDTANKDFDLSALEGIGSIYSKYGGKSSSVTSLPSGSIAVTCYADETSVPTALGGPQDLNFDNDAADVLSGVSAGTDLKVVPMQLTLSFVEKGVTQSITIYRLVTRTSD